MKNNIDIDMDKNKIDLYNFTLMFIVQIYNNKSEYSKNIAKESTVNFSKYFNIKDNHSSQIYYDFINDDINYLIALSTIIMMYHTFENFFTSSFKLKKEKGSLLFRIETFLKNYGYEIKEDNYYTNIKKYNALNNAIKHNNYKKLVKNYPEFLRKKHDCEQSGCILNDNLIITDDNIIECCQSIRGIVDNIYEFLQSNNLTN